MPKLLLLERQSTRDQSPTCRSEEVKPNLSTKPSMRPFWQVCTLQSPRASECALAWSCSIHADATRFTYSDNKDACAYSPAAAEHAVTVGASTLGDERAYFSNHGKCVDLFAPGLQITSTWNGGNDTTNTISGTSMASPHICGLLAYLLSIHPSITFSVSNAEIDAMPAIADGKSSLYTRAYSLLPKLVQAVLPTPPTFNVADLVTLAPIPKNGTLSTKQLKKALISLASPGMLTDLPAGTPNLLAFNNATF